MSSDILIGTDSEKHVTSHALALEVQVLYEQNKLEECILLIYVKLNHKNRGCCIGYLNVLQ